MQPSSLVSLVAEPGNIECEDQSPRESGTAMAVPAVPVAPGLISRDGQDTPIM